MADAADRACLGAGQSPGCGAWLWTVPVGAAFVLAVTLAGCNANQRVDVASQRGPGVVAGPNFPGYTPYNPVLYGQTSGFYGGR